MTNVRRVSEPLFHVIKRPTIAVWKRLLIYAVAIATALVLAAGFCLASSTSGKGFFEFFTDLFSGAFGTERKIWMFFRDGALLLGVALALLPAFRMRFWNLGANGQIVIGCLVSYACMLYFGEKANLPQGVIIPIMTVLSVGAAILWAVIPAIFKAIFKTNETLFTLMMNYIAQGLVAIMITVWSPSGSGTLALMDDKYGLINIVNDYLLTIMVVALITVVMYLYLGKSKHGYELALVGESENTARYAGVKVNKVVIRTLILSGAICGIIGLLLTGSINHSVNEGMHSNMGFTAIIATWLAQFNPLITIGTCFMITFITRGMVEVRSEFGFTNSALSNVIIGFIYFFIIGCDFFIRYKLVFRKKKKTETVKDDFMAVPSEKNADDTAGEPVSEEEKPSAAVTETDKTDVEDPPEKEETTIGDKPETVKKKSPTTSKPAKKSASKKSATKHAAEKPAGKKTSSTAKSKTVTSAAKTSAVKSKTPSAGTKKSASGKTVKGGKN